MTHAAKLLAALALASACEGRDTPPVKREPERPRRVIEPPARTVRALPPHAIRSEGVGPYKLGASAADLLDQLPSGPRIRQFSIPGIVHRDMLRGEDDAILIGTEPQGKATFVAVVRGEIARTEAGIQVGSTREEVERSLGPPLDEADRARDPRIMIPSKLDNARVVFDDERVAAIVLVPAIERSKDMAPIEQPCTRPPADRARRTFGICLSNTGEHVRVTGDEIAILTKETDRVHASTRVAGLVFAVPLRNPFDGRDDLVAVAHSQTGDARTWTLTVHRIADGRLLRVNEPASLYTITATNARWIGADLDQVELLLELTSRADSIEVGGLLTTRIADKVRDIVVISPVPVARRRVKTPPPEPPDAGLSDAGPR